MRPLLPFLFIFPLHLSPVWTWAGEPFSPIRSAKELLGPYHRSSFNLEVSHPIPGARVLSADYELIRRDFPGVQKMTEREIDDWLLKHFAVLSQDQIEVGAQRGVNSEILVDRKHFRPAIRPPNYGRALVLELEEGGMMEVKGAGGLASAISTSSHRSGLMETSEAIREMAYSKLVTRALNHSGSAFRTIDAYGVIDYGFQVKSAVDGTFQPAGALLRQSHFRDIKLSEQLDRKTARRIERTLREYGITTAYKKSPAILKEPKIYDILNVQGSAKEKFLFDFGGYRVVDHFENPAIILPDLFHAPVMAAVREQDLKTLQPRREFQKIFAEWGGEGTEERIWQRARAIANRHKSTGDTQAARREIEELLRTTRTIPSHTRAPADFSCMRKAVEGILGIPPGN